MQHQQKVGELPTHCPNDLSDPSIMTCNPIEPMIKYEDYENTPLVADGAFWEDVVMPGDPYNDFITHEGDEVVNNGKSWVVTVDDDELNNWSIIPIEPYNEYGYDDSEFNT